MCRLCLILEMKNQPYGTANTVPWLLTFVRCDWDWILKVEDFRAHVWQVFNPLWFWSNCNEFVSQWFRCGWDWILKNEYFRAPFFCKYSIHSGFGQTGTKFVSSSFVNFSNCSDGAIQYNEWLWCDSKRRYVFDRWLHTIRANHWHAFRKLAGNICSHKAITCAAVCDCKLHIYINTHSPIPRTGDPHGYAITNAQRAASALDFAVYVCKPRIYIYILPMCLSTKHKFTLWSIHRATASSLQCLLFCNCIAHEPQSCTFISTFAQRLNHCMYLQ